MVVIGGGPSGIELSSEIAHQFGKDKDVTLIHNKPQLIGDKYSTNFHKRVQDKLKKLNVKLRLGR